jgi:hypothetical protein
MRPTSRTIQGAQSRLKGQIDPALGSIPVAPALLQRRQFPMMEGALGGD